MSDVVSGEPIHWRVQPDEGEYVDLDEDIEIVDDDDAADDDDFEEELREGRDGAERTLE